MKVIVAGSRNFTNWLYLRRRLDSLTGKLNKRKLVILSGGAVGADKLGERWAKTNLVKCEVYKPDYSRYGRKAPLIRNQEMVELADVLIAFHLGDSPGTRDII